LAIGATGSWELTNLTLPPGYQYFLLSLQHLPFHHLHLGSELVHHVNQSGQ
jgi:hypothetical protein